MSYTERLTERLGVVGAVSAYNTAAATGATGATADMGDHRRALYGMVGNGTGTAGMTVQEGKITKATNPTTGEITSSGVAWQNLTWSGNTSTHGSTGTVTATAQVTNGQMSLVEVASEAMSEGYRYLRTLLNTGTAQTYASAFGMVGDNRFHPVTQDSDVGTTILIGDNAWA